MTAAALRSVAVVEEAREIIAAAGDEPTPVLPLVREIAEKYDKLGTDDIVRILRAEEPNAFQPRASSDGRRLEDMTDAEKRAFIRKHGLDRYLRLVRNASERRRGEIERKVRGF